MTEEEIELRAWLHQQAARVHASAKLLEADYKPRIRRQQLERFGRKVFLLRARFHVWVARVYRPRGSGD